MRGEEDGSCWGVERGSEEEVCVGGAEEECSVIWLVDGRYGERIRRAEDVVGIGSRKSLVKKAYAMWKGKTQSKYMKYQLLNTIIVKYKNFLIVLIQLID